MRIVNYIWDSWMGLAKKENQDEVHVIQDTDYSLFFLFDGVSSSPNSIAGIKHAIEFCDSNYKIYYKNNEYNLAHLIEDMNISLLKSKLVSPETTCCILYIPRESDRLIKFTHLGDSRIYSLDKHLTCLTRDDSQHGMPNMLTKCLGLERLREKDFYQKEIKLPEGRFLLCTDGFYHVMESFEDEFSFFLFNNVTKIESMKVEIENIVKFRNGDDATYILIDVLREKMPT